jgi:NADH-quinone oxidoreductase subunit G
MYTVKLKINEIPVEVEAGTSILEAAAGIGIKIPTLCHMNLHEFDVEHKPASCRVCQVEIKGRGLMTSCSTPVYEGMEVFTNTQKALRARRVVLELILSDHPKDCLLCDKSGNCELQTLAEQLHLRKIRFKGKTSKHAIDISSQSIVRDMNKCIMCRRCETMCNEVQTVGALSNTGRGFDSVMDTAMHRPLNDTKCTFCGQCAAVCPTGALMGIEHINEVWRALNDPSKFVVVQIAPATRVAIGEIFGMEPGTIATGQMISGLRRLGFKRVFDTNFGADLTVMEEANEFIERFNNGGKLPMLTSCCPSWVKFFEHQFPDLLDIPSTCKSPQQMFGSIAKTFYANKIGVKPKDIVVVSIMPCLAKKYECARDEFKMGNIKEVDYSVSTRELGFMFEEACIDLKHLPNEDFDHPLGDSSGAAVIFGNTGGVLEATLRTAAELLEQKPLENVDFHAVRGLEGFKETEVEINGIKIKAGIASGLGNARKLLEKIRAGEADYHIIEIMACPGGCISGGGQPYHHGDTTVLQKRSKALYEIDKGSEIRVSSKNEAIKALYDEFLEKPGSKKAHDLLHTTYTKRTRE